MGWGLMTDSTHQRAAADDGALESASATWLGRRAAPLRSVFAALRIVSAPIAIAILAALVFALPDQIRDIYRDQAESLAVRLFLTAAERDPLLDGSGWARFFYGVIAVWLLAATLAAACQYAAQRLAARAAMVDATPPARWVLTLAPAVAYALPLAGYLIGLELAFERDVSGATETVAALNQASDTVRLTVIGQIGNLLDLLQGRTRSLGIGLAIAFLLLGVLILRRPWDRAAPSPRGRALRRVAFIVLFAGAIVAFALWPVALPQEIGALALLALFFLVAAFIVTQLSVWSQRFSTPLISIIIIAGVFFSAMGWTDNHRIRPPGRPA